VSKSLLILMLAVGVANVMFTPPAQRVSALFGQTWLACPWMVLVLSLPAMLAVFRALEGLAPTRLRLAGFAAVLGGLLGPRLLRW